MSTKQTFLTSLLPLLVVGFAGCNTFDPNLGNAPFRCGTDSPRCPDNYTCVTYSATEEICEADNATDRADGGPDQPDANTSDFTCNSDSEIEPNNTIDDATRPIIPPSGIYRLVSLAVCPTTDNDFFEFEVGSGTPDLIVEIEYMSARGALSLELYKGDGSLLMTGTPAGGNDDILRIAIQNVLQDTYFARVSPGETGVENNYNFQITLTP